MVVPLLGLQDDRQRGVIAGREATPEGRHHRRGADATLAVLSPLLRFLVTDEVADTLRVPVAVAGAMRLRPLKPKQELSRLSLLSVNSDTTRPGCLATFRSLSKKTAKNTKAILQNLQARPPVSMRSRAVTQSGSTLILRKVVELSIHSKQAL